jgi:hypothetical protein
MHRLKNLQHPEACRRMFPRRMDDASAQVGSLTDSKGNVYRLAVGPTGLTGTAPLSQAVYYAQNIKAALHGANTVTVRFNAAAGYPDIRILEHSGVEPAITLSRPTLEIQPKR